MRYLFIVFLLSTLFSCAHVDEELALRSIVNKPRPESLTYSSKIFKDFYSQHPYTVYYKVKMDESYYQYLIQTYTNSCIDDYSYFSVKLVGNHLEDRSYTDVGLISVPDWFDPGVTSVDAWSFFNMNSYNVVRCDDWFNATYKMAYASGHCYIILESAPQTTDDPDN